MYIFILYVIPIYVYKDNGSTIIIYLYTYMVILLYRYIIIIHICIYIYREVFFVAYFFRHIYRSHFLLSESLKMNSKKLDILDNILCSLRILILLPAHSWVYYNCCLLIYLFIDLTVIF